MHHRFHRRPITARRLPGEAARRALMVTVCGASLLACGEDLVDTDVLGPCEGGGEGTVEMGTGGRIAFEPWLDGDSVDLSEDASGWGIRVEMLTTGLDTTAAATSVLRVQFEPGAPTEDYVGQVMLQCDEEEGIAWIAVQAPLPEPWQGYPGSLGGASIDLDLTVTDATGEAASDTVSVVVAVP